MGETSTSDLLGAAGAGDQRAFVALVRSQGPRIYTIAFRGSIRLYGLPAGDCRVRVCSEARDPCEKGVMIELGRTATLVAEVQ
jgi:hypothetical protein